MIMEYSGLDGAFMEFRDGIFERLQRFIIGTRVPYNPLNTLGCNFLLCELCKRFIQVCPASTRSKLHPGNK
jgi:hypothetical protein